MLAVVAGDESGILLMSLFELDHCLVCLEFPAIIELLFFDLPLGLNGLGRLL